MEFLNFAVLLVVFVLCLSSKHSGTIFYGRVIKYTTLFTDAETRHMTAYEILFIVFAVSFTLKEYTASREHGLNSKPHDFRE